MKRIGIIGGMSWESTSDYYRRLNVLARQHFGGLHSAELLIESVDFAPLAELQQNQDWDAIGEILLDSGRRLEAAGAEVVLICSNTMHRVAPILQTELAIPLLHIAEAVLAEARTQEITKIGLLATRFTMEAEFYCGYLKQAGLEVCIPDQAHRTEVHRVIYEELCQGKFLDSSKTSYLEVISSLEKSGAEAIVLGCTEIGLLVKASDTHLPLLDTTALHTEYAFQWSIR